MGFGSCEVSERFQGKTDFPCGGYIGSRKGLYFGNICLGRYGELDKVKLRSPRFPCPKLTPSKNQVSQQLQLIDWSWVSQRHGISGWWIVGLAHMPPFWALSCINWFMYFCLYGFYPSSIIQCFFLQTHQHVKTFFTRFNSCFKLKSSYCFFHVGYWGQGLYVM